IKPIFKLDKVKRFFFLIILLDIIDYIINNLLTYNVTFFIDIKLKMLNLAKKYSINIKDTLAYLVRTFSSN
ncbi:hypothetical protein P153DRAFT_294430, partial [Dothidotthia symphoricarpi CBS 119687]